MPGDRGSVGGILGIDPRSFDRGLAERAARDESAGPAGEDAGGKVRVVREGGKGKDKG